MADPERNGQNFKDVAQFLKSSRISLAYGLTSNKQQILSINVGTFSCYIEEYDDFVPFLDAFWGAWPRLGHFYPRLKAMAPRHQLVRVCVCPR